MKKLLIALSLTLACVSGAAAQEVSISYGAYTQMDVVNNHKGFSDVNTAWGAVNVSLYCPVAKNFMIGPSYTYSSAFTPKGSYNVPYIGEVDLKSQVGYHVLLLNFKYNYYQNSIVKLYAHLGAGAVISHMMPKGQPSYNKGYFAGHISPIGADVNITPHVSMFGELGFGAQGLLQVGFKYQF